MNYSNWKLVLLTLAFSVLMQPVAAANQLSVYAEDSGGYPVTGVNITVEGLETGYYQSEYTGDSAYANFYGYTSGREYRITVDQRGGNLYASKVVSLSPDETVFIQLSPNHDPSVTLEEPGKDATGVALRPMFEWSVSDPDGDSLDLTLYIEEKDYSSDRPWGGNRYEVSGDSFRPSSELEEGTEYVWGVRADDGKGGSDGAYRSFTPRSETDAQPSVTLREPDSGETGVSLRPDFEWSVDSPDGVDRAYLYVEKKDYSSDRPWSGTKYTVTGDTSFQV
ncbi:MAG: hypothetical protein ABEJ66_02295, partial [Candidatus Nanohaloarchaea archaeon]